MSQEIRLSGLWPLSGEWILCCEAYFSGHVPPSGGFFSFGLRLASSLAREMHPPILNRALTEAETPSRPPSWRELDGLRKQGRIED
jgi:hypothetical protein